MVCAGRGGAGQGGGERVQNCAPIGISDSKSREAVWDELDTHYIYKKRAISGHRPVLVGSPDGFWQPG